MNLKLARFLTTALAGLAFAGAGHGQPRYDVILRNGSVLDGTGRPAVRTDIGIVDGRIVGLGNLAGAQGAKVIDVAGLTVAPGFINIHDHPRPKALAQPTNMLSQGVTTEIFNPDGGVSFPAGTDPLDLDAQLGAMGAAGLGVNIGGYIGFNAIWEAVVGKANRRPSPEEIARMRGYVTRAFQAGAFGLSAGLDYKPGYFAKLPEVVAVAKAAGPWRTIFPNHEAIRPENGYSSFAGVSETLHIGAEAGVAPEITHIKSQGVEQGGAERILDAMKASTAAGHWAPGDLYPYTAGQSGLAWLLVPGWAMDGGRPALLDRFKDTDTRRRISAEIETAMNARFGGAGGVYLPQTRQQLTAVMAGEGVGPGEAVIRTLEKADVSAILTFGADADIVRFMQDPDIAIACDCGAADAPDVTHPRYFGTFPRVLGRYVRDEHRLSLPEAVRRMSGLPASIVGLTDRGLIAPGMAADITVFDSRTIADHATYEQPTLPSEGVRYVLVNGALAFDQGRPTGAKGGQPLRRGQHAPSRPMAPGARAIAGESPLQWNGAAAVARFSLSQTDDTGTARGEFRILDRAGKTLLASASLGVLQAAPGWASFTAVAQSASGAQATVSVIVDAADPAAPGRTTLVIDSGGRRIEAIAPTGAVRFSGAAAPR